MICLLKFIQEQTGSKEKTFLYVIHYAVIFLPAHPASFAHNVVSGMQSFYFRESQDAIVLQTCH